MSFATAARDIEQRLKDNWATTVIDLNPDVRFKPPADDAWIKLRVFNESSTRINIGRPGIHRANGSVAIEIYTPLGEGTRRGLGYGDTLAALFRDVQFNGLTFREANVEPVGEFEQWWQTTMFTTFYWDGRY